MEADTIKQVEMKEKIKKGYLRWTRKLLETKLCSRNLIKGINTWAEDIIIKGTGGLGNRRTSGDHPNYYIIENGQNTEKSPGDLRRLATTQTPVKDHQLAMMWKTLKELIIIIIIRSEYREETCYHSNSSESPSANAGVKNSKGIIIVIIIITTTKLEKSTSE